MTNYLCGLIDRRAVFAVAVLIALYALAAFNGSLA